MNASLHEWYNGQGSNKWITVSEQEHEKLLHGRQIELPIVSIVGSAPIQAKTQR